MQMYARYIPPARLKLFAPTARYFPSSRSDIFFPLLSGRLRSSRFPSLLFLLHLIFIRPSGLSLTTRSTRFSAKVITNIGEIREQSRYSRNLSRNRKVLYVFPPFNMLLNEARIYFPSSNVHRMRAILYRFLKLIGFLAIFTGYFIDYVRYSNSKEKKSGE